jgi:hypothetical protein
VELIVLILVVLVALAVLSRGGFSLMGLVINAVVGLVLLVLTNLFITPPIPLNILTVLICAIGGVVGWLVILILHILGIAFYVAV